LYGAVDALTNSQVIDFSSTVRQTTIWFGEKDSINLLMLTPKTGLARKTFLYQKNGLKWVLVLLPLFPVEINSMAGVFEADHTIWIKAYSILTKETVTYNYHLKSGKFDMLYRGANFN
jgi:hypothetical protein